MRGLAAPCTAQNVSLQQFSLTQLIISPLALRAAGLGQGGLRLDLGGQAGAQGSPQHLRPRSSRGGPLGHEGAGLELDVTRP